MLRVVLHWPPKHSSVEPTSHYPKCSVSSVNCCSPFPIPSISNIPALSASPFAHDVSGGYPNSSPRAPISLAKSSISLIVRVEARCSTVALFPSSSPASSGSLEIASNLPRGEHTATVELLPDPPDRAVPIESAKKSNRYKPADFEGVALHLGAICVLEEP
jgi:hypothetical protein